MAKASNDAIFRPFLPFPEINFGDPTTVGARSIRCAFSGHFYSPKSLIAKDFTNPSYVA